MAEQGSFVDPDGVTVTYRSWLAAADLRGVAVIAHGASEHSGRYERFATALAAAGFAVLAPDHRGHGLTAPSTGPGVIGPRGLDGVLDDLDCVVELGRTAAPTVPLVLVGHSMGSVIALRYAETRGTRLAALVLSGPLGVVPGVEEQIAQLEPAVAGGMGDTPVDALGAFNAEFEPARTPYDWLSRDPDEVDAYLADPFCGDDMPLTYGYLLAVLQGTRDGAERAADIPDGLPVLVTAGERDPVSAGGVQARALAGLLRDGGAEVSERYYPDARHEVLNETNRDEVEADIVGWLDAAVPRPSTATD